MRFGSALCGFVCMLCYVSGFLGLGFFVCYVMLCFGVFSLRVAMEGRKEGWDEVSSFFIYFDLNLYDAFLSF